jgi:MFS family permease
VARWLILGRILSAVGSGLVQPLLVVYLIQLRHFPVFAAAATITVIAVASFAGAGLAGMLIDRASLRFAAVVHLVAAAVGTGTFALAASLPLAYTSAVVFGLGMSGASTVWSAAVAACVPDDAGRARMFGAQFAGINAGLGIGGLIAGITTSTKALLTFQVLYVCDAASFLVACAILLVVVRPAPGSETSPRGAPPAGGHYRALLSDRNLVVVLVVTLGLFLFGYGQLEASIPAFVTLSGLGPSTVAAAYVVNTACVVIVQLTLGKRLAAVSNRRAVMSAALLWAGGWAVLAVCAATQIAAVTQIAVPVFLGIFGVGEVLVAVTLPVLVNGLADDATRGRYNAAYSWAISCGMIIGPLLGGSLILAIGAPPLFCLLAVGCCAALPLIAHNSFGANPARDEVAAPG